MLRLTKRHLASCSKTSETDFNCVAKAGKKTPAPRCPFRIVGPHPRIPGQRYVEKLDTADRRAAELKLVEVERSFLLDEPEKWDLMRAITAFRNTKAGKSRERRNKVKRVLYRMTSFLAKAAPGEPDTKIEELGAKLIITPNFPTKPDLNAFVGTFTGAISSRKADRSILKEFWKWCHDNDITPKNLGQSITKIGTPREEELHRKKRIPTFDPKEVNAIGQVLAGPIHKVLERENQQDPDASEKTRVFILVQMATGFAISDVTTLHPSDLKGACADNKDQIRVEKFRIKTGKTAYTSIPKWLADELNSIKRDSEYYFWSGKGDPENRTTTFRERMKKVFISAGVRVYDRTAVRRSGGKLKKAAEDIKDSHADPHMWRHTLVRDLYTMDRPVREIADILGDDPAIVTRFYSQFDELRRKKVANTMRSLHAQHSILGAGNHHASSD